MDGSTRDVCSSTERTRKNGGDLEMEGVKSFADLKAVERGTRSFSKFAVSEYIMN